MKYLMQFLMLMFLILFSSCSTTGKLNKLSAGQPKSQVLELLGNPDSTSLNSDEIETLRYSLSPDGLRQEPYLIFIKNGKLQKFGHATEFMTDQQRSQYYQNKAHEAQRWQDISDSFNNASNNIRDAGRAPASNFTPNNVKFCRVNNFGHIGMCFITLQMCQSSIQQDEACIAK